MKVDIETLKKLQGMLSSLEEEGISFSDESGYLTEEEYGELVWIGVCSVKNRSGRSRGRSP